MTVEDARIQMVVVDRAPMFALGLCSLIEKRPHIRALAFDLADLTEVASPASGDSADIVLLDPGQFDLSPAELAHRVKARFAGRGMIAYIIDSEIAVARACLTAGFRGILPRSAGLEPLLAANRPLLRSTLLIDRETYVLKSAAYGKSLQEIGQELALSSKTIAIYKAPGSGKLNLQGRRAIVELAIRNGGVKAEKRLT